MVTQNLQWKYIKEWFLAGKHSPKPESKENTGETDLSPHLPFIRPSSRCPPGFCQGWTCCYSLPAATAANVCSSKEPVHSWTLLLFLLVREGTCPGESKCCQLHCQLLLL